MLEWYHSFVTVNLIANANIIEMIGSRSFYQATGIA